MDWSDGLILWIDLMDWSYGLILFCFVFVFVGPRHIVLVSMNHWSYLDGRLVPKISKRHFFRDIQNSFHEVTHIGLEPHQIFSFWNISTNMVARGVQSFGRNGPWWAGCLKYGQNFLIKFAQTCDEQMLKISRRYLDSCLI